MILVRIYARRGTSPEVHKVSRFPVTIGRALDNDLVVSEPSVSLHHARIETNEAGELVLRDAESTNGLFYNSQNQTVVPLKEICQVKLGQVWLEFVPEEQAMEGTLRLGTSNADRDWRYWMRIALSIVALLGICFAVELVVFQATGIVKFETSSFFQSAILASAAVLLVSGFFSLFSKVHIRRYQFPDFFWLALASYSFARLALAFAPWIEFNLRWPALWLALSTIVKMAFAFIGLSSLAALLFREIKWKRRIWIVSGLIAVLFAVQVILGKLKEEQLQEPDFAPAIASSLWELKDSPDSTALIDAKFAKIDESIEQERLEAASDEPEE